MFCSEKCQIEAMKGLHQYECNKTFTVFPFGYPSQLIVYCFSVFKNNVTELRKFLEANKDPVTVFDFDFSDPEVPMYKKNMLLVAMSKVITKQTPQLENLIPQMRLSTFTDLHKTFEELYQTDPSLLDFIKTSFEISLGSIVTNFHSQDINLYRHFSQQSSFKDDRMTATLIGSATYPLRKLLNHSCNSNVDSLNVSGKNVLYACKPIKKGAKLFHSEATMKSLLASTTIATLAWKSGQHYWECVQSILSSSTSQSDSCNRMIKPRRSSLGTTRTLKRSTRNTNQKWKLSAPLRTTSTNFKHSLVHRFILKLFRFQHCNSS
jgi:hypothetical protein